MFLRPIHMQNIKSLALKTILLSLALLHSSAVPSFAASIKVVPSSLRASAGDALSVDIVVENIPAEGLGALQFRLQVEAPGSPVIGISETALAGAAVISVATPLNIGPAAVGRSGLGSFFWSAVGPNGVLVMDNEDLVNGSALFTYGHTSDSNPPSGSGSVATFQLVVGTDVVAKKIFISLSDVMLLNSGTEYALESNSDAVIDLGCGAVVPGLIGLSLQDAHSLLQSAGLTVGNVVEIDNPNGSLLLNQVLQQTPAADSAVLCDSSVDLAINSAPSDVSLVSAADKTGDQAGAAVLSWAPSISSDTAGYRIYRLSETPSLVMEIGNPGAAGTEISGLPNGQAVQLKVTSFDVHNNESLGVVVSVTPLDDVVPTVWATPVGGTFTTATSVTLEADELSDIYFTTDGSAPTVNSLRYVSAIPLVASAVINILAIDRAGNASSTMTETYVVRSSTIAVSCETSKAHRLAATNIYLFKENGVYTNNFATTDASGNATFNVGSLTSGNYKFRVDYLGYQFWSGVLTLPGAAQTTVSIAEETAEVTLSPAVSGIKVYLFTQAGSYMNKFNTSSSSGKTTFDLPLGKTYKFRADYLGAQYWSSEVTVAAGGTNPVLVNLGGGTLTVTLQKQAGNPITGVQTYLYTSAGSYLNQSKTSDSSGAVSYSVSAGTYRVRADYLGYQFWTSDVSMSSGDMTAPLNMPHTMVTSVVSGAFQGANTPLLGVPCYLFTAEGTYLNITRTTNSAGSVTFELPQKEYKVRADYMGQQYWSQVFNSLDAPVNVPMSDAQATVTGSGLPLSGVYVYLFSSAGSYMNISGATDSSGLVSFRVPAGNYLFRADYQAKQFWSAAETLVADAVMPVSISTGGGSFVLHLQKDAQTPLIGAKCYVFNEGGPYLNMSGITDAEGEVSFGLADGNYQFRIDQLGYQFWTDVLSVPAILEHTQLVEHRDNVITVQGQYSFDIRPMGNVKVYLFHTSGTYLQKEGTTDLDGRVQFSLPQMPYLVRADYLGQQFWSDPFTAQDTGVVIPEGVAGVTVRMNDQPVAGQIVYVFDAAGAYLNMSGSTDTAGYVEFRLPAGTFRFRTTYQSQEFWITAGVAEGVLNEIELGSTSAAFGLNIDTGSGPLAGAKVYVFNAAGSYLGMTGDTDASGRISFSLVEGSFKFRIDYLGYQYWTEAIAIPATTQHNLTIPHRSTAVTVQGLLDTEVYPMSSLPVYLFNTAGSYLGLKMDTDVNGQAFFFLPDADYRLRADFLGDQFWTDTFRFTDPALTINEGRVRIIVNRSGAAVTGAKVYLFSDSGPYLGRFGTTDSTGEAEFTLPDRNFDFRVDEGGYQYWTGEVVVLPNQTNELNLDLNGYVP